MPFTYLEIEKRKNRVICFLFLLLVALYFLGAYLLVAVTPLGYFFSGPGLKQPGGQLVHIAFFALLAAACHWFLSTFSMIKNILDALCAHAPDPEDTRHQMFQNIVDEVSVAVGGRLIECVCLPTVALNAFSVSDFRGRAVIGVTEGILSRLSRAQLEAVVAHEAAHIVAGDSLIKTVSVSLFGVYGALMRSLEKSGRWLAEGREQAFVHPLGIGLYLVAACMYFLTKLLSMFISRQCEYRADATAVRLVRDPLSLAQSLYRIQKKWRGGGLGYEYMESIFIFNPNYSPFDDREGWFADLFSTHPPAAKRIAILLGMVHSDAATLAQSAETSSAPRTIEVATAAIHEARWYVAQANQWIGPLLPVEVAKVQGVAYDSFVRKETSSGISILCENKELSDALQSGGHGAAQSGACPRCGQGLYKVSYEGVPVLTCRLCKGALLEHDKLPRIIAREEQGFSHEVIRQAAVIQELTNKKRAPVRVQVQSGLKCPGCKLPMVTNFYSLVYLIEVDRCVRCNMVWFDRYELEVLQYLIEKACNK